MITYFDNIGKYITRSYRVKSSKISSADIITVTLNIPMVNDTKKNLQCIELPQNKMDVSEKQKLMKDAISSSNENFRNYRLNYIRRILSLVFGDVCSSKVEFVVVKESRFRRVWYSGSDIKLFSEVSGFDSQSRQICKND